MEDSSRKTKWSGLTPEQHRKRHVWKYISLKTYYITGEQNLAPLRLIVFTGGVTGGVKEGWWLMFVIGFVWAVVCVTFGLIWDWRGYYSTELEWRASRNPFAQQVREKLKL